MNSHKSILVGHIQECIMWGYDNYSVPQLILIILGLILLQNNGLVPMSFVVLKTLICLQYMPNNNNVKVVILTISNDMLEIYIIECFRQQWDKERMVWGILGFVLTHGMICILHTVT